MEIQLTQQDGLLAFDDASTSHYLTWNPMVFHAEFHRICQQIYQQMRPEPAYGQSALHKVGFDVIDQMVPADEARGLSDIYAHEAIEQEGSANTVITPSPKLKTDIINVINNYLAGTEALIESYLGCFFRVHHVDLMRSRPAEDLGHSYKWHRDFDPMSKIHILIYLTDCGPESPATEFMNLDDTRRCVDQGYIFPAQTKRIDNIGSLFEDGTAPIKTVRPELKAGDATIFTPSRILHRGVMFDEDYRDLLVLNILPSLNPWDAEIDHLGTERLFAPSDTLFFDPFTQFKPLIESADGIEVPIWAQHGYHFPLT